MEQNAPLLDPRLRFPVHALPHERVVWAGSAAPSAWRAAVLSLLLQFSALVSVFGVLLVGSTSGEAACRVQVEQSAGKGKYRDCTDAERRKAVEDRQRIRYNFGRSAFGLLALVVLGQSLANALRRRHLVYIVTNERVVVQDGYLGIRLDTIDLDHVVSITAKAGLVERWFGVKSVSVTVPGQKAAIWQRGAMLANAIELWGLPAQDPALSQLLNVWLPRSRG